MAHVLQFHFDPDFEHRRLRPRARENGSVDQFDLGYVQNVVAGQVLAEWRDLPPGETADPRFVSEEKTFPAGPGCGPSKKDPNRLVALVNGHVSFDGGRITVSETLTVDRDIDFHTGNIISIGDVVVTGTVRTGFEVAGRNVTVRGMVEGARIRAMGSVSCEAGIQGGEGAVVRAGESVKAKFCQNARIHAGKSILIEDSSMHCRLFAGEKLAVKGRLTGGEVYSGQAVFVGGRLGGGPRSQTRLLLGYDPERVHKDIKLKDAIREIVLDIKAYQAEVAKGGKFAEEYRPLLSRAEKRLAIHKAMRVKLWSQESAMRDLSACRLVVPGTIGSNVDVGIGEAYVIAPEGATQVVFRYQDREVVMEPLPPKG